MPMLKINSSNYYYELHGEGIPVVLISGIRSDHSRWLPVLKKLVAHFQVLIFDNRGVGQTIDLGETLSIESMADETVRLITQLKIKQPHILGYSFGGAIAQQIAKDNADKISSIALCNTFAKFSDESKKLFKDIIPLYQAGASPGEIAKHVAPWVYTENFLTLEVLQNIQNISDENPFPQSLSDYERQLDALCNFDSRNWLNSINLPTLVMGANEDRIATPINSKELANNIDGSKLIMIPSVGHGSYIEAPDLFVNYLCDFYNDKG
jgi:3-oxoadipate enol-lactonase